MTAPHHGQLVDGTVACCAQQVVLEVVNVKTLVVFPKLEQYVIGYFLSSRSVLCDEHRIIAQQLVVSVENLMKGFETAGANALQE